MELGCPLAALGGGSRRGPGPPAARRPGGRADLEVQVQDVVLMEVVHALADLLGEQDHVQLGQVVLLLRDPVEEFAPVHAAGKRTGRPQPEGGAQRTPLSPPREPQGAAVVWGLTGTLALAPSQLIAQAAERKGRAKGEAGFPQGPWGSLWTPRAKAANSFAYTGPLASTRREPQKGESDPFPTSLELQEKPDTCVLMRNFPVSRANNQIQRTRQLCRPHCRPPTGRPPPWPRFATTASSSLPRYRLEAERRRRPRLTQAGERKRRFA